jgi:hypothetical protein
MTTCAVLRCQTPGSAVVTGGQYLNQIHEAYICAEHNEKIGAGERWDIQEGHVLMDQDMPPALEKCSSRSSVGTQGFTLTLETSDHQTKPFDLFITPEQAKHLYMLLKTRGGE